jgi:hypothetical protein
MPGKQGRERPDYRVGWRSHEAALAYEEDLHREASETGWLNEIERQVLTEVVDRQLGGREIRYLDFACGTGEDHPLSGGARHHRHRDRGRRRHIHRILICRRWCRTSGLEQG